MDYIIPILVIMVVGVLLLIVKIVANLIVKVPPNRVAVFYGKKRTTADGKVVGFRLITGGSKIRVPIFENVAFLDLNVFSIDLSVTNAPNKDGVLVNIRGVANVKILSDEVSLMAACERFLGMKPEQIKEIAYKNLEGHLRGIIGRLTVEEMVSSRQKFNQEVLQEAGEDLRKIGLGLDVLTIQEIEDQYGYIKALGQRRTAEVMRDATVGRSQAERDATIGKSQADRDAVIGKAEADRDAMIRETTAKREAAQTSNQNLALIAEAEKLRDVKKAQYLAEVQREQALAAQAGPLAEAEARKAVVERQVEVERARTVKEAEVALAEADKQEKQLLATVVRPAEAERQAAVARADGERQVAIAVAEGQRQATIKTAEAEQFKREMEGKGLGAAIRAQGEAEAGIIRLKLVAEAEGIMKRAEAFKQLDEAGRLLQILDAVGRILPESLEKLAPVMGEIAKPLGNVDRISIVDFGGGGGGNGSTGVSRFAQTVPTVLVQLFESLKAVGLDPAELQRFLKVQSTPPVSGEARLPMAKKEE